MLTRRTFLKGLVASTAGLLLPASAGVEIAEPERRYWALGAVLDKRIRVFSWDEHGFRADHRLEAEASVLYPLVLPSLSTHRGATNYHVLGEEPVVARLQLPYGEIVFRKPNLTPEEVAFVMELSRNLAHHRNS